MAIDTEALRAKAREIDEAEADARRFKEEIGKRIRISFVAAGASTGHVPMPEDFKPATWEQLVTEVEAGRALDAMVENRKAELDALVNGKPKRKRAKKAEKPAEPKVRRALGRKGLPKGEAVPA